MFGRFQSSTAYPEPSERISTEHHLAQEYQDNKNGLTIIVNSENLSESAQCSLKTASFSECHKAEDNSLVSPSGEPNYLTSQGSYSRDFSDLSEKINIYDSKSVFPCQADSQTSSDSLSSPQTIITLNLDTEILYPTPDNDPSANSVSSLQKDSKFSHLYVNTTLANETFECYVTANHLAHRNVQASGYFVCHGIQNASDFGIVPGYSMCKEIHNSVDDSKLNCSQNLPNSQTLKHNWRPVDEYLEYYCKTTDMMSGTPHLLIESSQSVCPRQEEDNKCFSNDEATVCNQDALDIMSTDETYQHDENTHASSPSSLPDDGSHQSAHCTYQHTSFEGEEGNRIRFFPWDFQASMSVVPCVSYCVQNSVSEQQMLTRAPSSQGLGSNGMLSSNLYHEPYQHLNRQSYHSAPISNLQEVYVTQVSNPFFKSSYLFPSYSYPNIAGYNLDLNAWINLPRRQ